jgi:hypothetical protein
LRYVPAPCTAVLLGLGVAGAILLRRPGSYNSFVPHSDDPRHHPLGNLGGASLWRSP